MAATVEVDMGGGREAGAWGDVHDRLAPEDERVSRELWERIREQRRRLMGTAMHRCIPGRASGTINDGRRRRRR